MSISYFFFHHNIALFIDEILLEKLNYAVALREATALDVMAHSEQAVSEDEDDPICPEMTNPYLHQLKALSSALHSDICAIIALQTRRRVHGRRK